MRKKCLFLTSCGLTDAMKKRFFACIGKAPEKLKILYIPTAGIATDGAREGFAVCLDELLRMGVRMEHILVYNLELLLSKGYRRTYSACVHEPAMVARVLTAEELLRFDAVFVSGGDSNILSREMIRTGFDQSLKQAVSKGLVYVGISAGSMYAAGNLSGGLHMLPHSIIPHWQGPPSCDVPDDQGPIYLADGQACIVEGECIRLI